MCVVLGEGGGACGEQGCVKRLWEGEKVGNGKRLREKKKSVETM